MEGTWLNLYVHYLSQGAMIGYVFRLSIYAWLRATRASLKGPSRLHVPDRDTTYVYWDLTFD